MIRWKVSALLVAVGLVVAASPGMAQDDDDDGEIVEEAGGGGGDGGSGEEERRVLITKFQAEGKSPQRLADEALLVAAQSLSEWYKLVSIESYNNAVESLGITEETDETWAQIGAELGIHGVLSASVTKDGRIYKIAMTVRSGNNGAVLESGTVELRRTKLKAPDKEKIANQALALMNKALSADAKRIAEEKEAKRLAEEQARKDAAAAAKKEEQEWQRKKEEQARLKKALARQKAAAGLVPVRGTAHLGMSFIGRTLQFSLNDLAPGDFTPYGYDGSLASGVAIDGEVYPLGSLGNRYIAGIGIGLSFDRTLALKSTQDGMEEFDSVQMAWGAGLRYAYELGDKPDEMTVRARVGYNSLGHSIDFGDMVYVPDVNYAYVDVGAGFRMMVIPKLAAAADVRYLVVLSTGTFAEADNYGGTSAWGLDFDLGADYEVIPNVLVRAGVRYTRMSLSFDGTGALTQVGGVGEQYVDGASDTFLGAYLTGGYRF